MCASSPSTALVLFLRYPEPGRVKSRLAQAVGPKEAAHIYEVLLRRTMGILIDFKRLQPHVQLFLAFTPPEREILLRKRFDGPWDFFPQEGSHLGERMEKAILHTFGLGHENVLLTGADLLDTKAEDFIQAMDAVSLGHAVLGPALDGGFYLIGLNRPCGEALRPDQWGNADVCLRTEHLLRKDGFQVARTSLRRDVDRPEDLTFFHNDPLLHRNLSVVIPTVSGPGQLAPLLNRLKAGLWPGDEIVIVRGTERPRHRISTHSGQGSPLRTTQSQMGRGLQLNAGARATRGDLLFFLHDDSLPPEHFSYAVRKVCLNSDLDLGCFSLAFSPSTPGLDLIAAGANLRTRLLGLPYGDQGLHCSREAYERAGGFEKPYLLEDVEFVKNCRRFGKLRILPEGMLTSPRRYLKRGIIRTWLKNQLILLLYGLGVPNKTLEALYYQHKEKAVSPTRL